jgi:hypothetical protein
MPEIRRGWWTLVSEVQGGENGLEGVKLGSCVMPIGRVHITERNAGIRSEAGV